MPILKPRPTRDNIRSVEIRIADSPTEEMTVHIDAQIGAAPNENGSVEVTDRAPVAWDELPNNVKAMYENAVRATRQWLATDTGLKQKPSRP